MKRLSLLVLCILSFESALYSQDLLPRAPYPDSNYLESIASVQFYLKGFPLRMPMVHTEGTLELRFDDLHPDFRRFTYRIIHCDADWTRSDLDRTEYLRGYGEEKIEKYLFSSQTEQAYCHYQLNIPNPEIGLLVSGNYVLVVYLDEEEKRIAFTRRFIAIERKVKVNAEFIRPLDVSKAETHHEINFTITHEDFPIEDPMNEVKVTILQNWRWDMAIMLKSPRFARNQSIDYNEYGQFLFPAGNEFRPLDISSLTYRAPQIYSIDHYKNGIEVVAETDRIRAGKNYLDYEDLNGSFVILNRDRSGLSQSTIPSQNYLGSVIGMEYQHIESEYVTAFFTLEAPQTLRNPVYLTGGFANWNALPQYRMQFDPVEQIYYTQAYLKQGYFDYCYVEKEPGGILSSHKTEGNYFETANEYLILVYYRPFGGRIDRVIAASSLISG